MFRRLANVRLRFSQRAYATSSSAAGSGKTRKTQFDKSMLKPALVVIIFGSMLNHVSNQQKRFAELERRYDLKIEILKDLLTRAKNGDVDFVVDKELDLVNKLFSRYTNSSNVSVTEEASKIRSKHDSYTYSRKEVLDSLNHSSGSMDDESLDVLLKSIIEEVNDVPPKKIGNYWSKAKDKERTISQESVPADGIIMDRDILEQEAKKEKQFEDYTPSTELHLIVENPGELSSAAEDTKIAKFL